MAPARTSAKQVARQPARPAPAASRGVAGARRSRFSGIGNYFREVRTELRKVVWPTRREVLNLTAVTLALAMLVGAFLGGVDFVFQEFSRFLLRLVGG